MEESGKDNIVNLRKPLLATPILQKIGIPMYQKLRGEGNGHSVSYEVKNDQGMEFVLKILDLTMKMTKVHQTRYLISHRRLIYDENQSKTYNKGTTRDEQQDREATLESIETKRLGNVRLTTFGKQTMEIKTAKD